MFPPFNQNSRRRHSRRKSSVIADVVTSATETSDQLVDAGLALAKQQMHRDAISYFEKALALSTNHLRALKNRALTYVHLGQTREALVDLDRLIDLDPQNLWAYANRAIIFRDLGHYGNAVSDFGHLIKHDRVKRWQWLISRGSTFKLMGHYEEALQDFNLSLKLKPDNSWAISARDEMVLQSRHYS
ncbi:MAG: tetratricopeptide repeat protein [Leptolyngbya sp. SIO3F4]|nr:tetratricopeptide repeat protein [Leptolyngbya sp. SIO3F4]